MSRFHRHQSTSGGGITLRATAPNDAWRALRERELARRESERFTRKNKLSIFFAGVPANPKRTESQRVRVALWRKNNPEKVKAHNKRNRNGSRNRHGVKYPRNKERDREYARKYRLENRDKCRAYQKEYHAKNKDRINARKNLQRKLNPKPRDKEKDREYARQYRLNHPDKILAYRRKHQPKKK